MANTNAPFGLRPIAGKGAPPNFELDIMYILGSNNTAIYYGDLVKRLSTGYIAQWTATTAVSQCAGVFMGCEYLSSSRGVMVRNAFWPGSDAASTTVIKAHILPISQAAQYEFVIQTDATGAAITDIGQNVDVAMGTGSTIRGTSGMYVDMSTQNTTATLPLRIVDIWGTATGPLGRGNVGPGADNTTNPTPYNWVVVRTNQAGVTGI